MIELALKAWSNETVYIVDDDPAVLDAIDTIIRGVGLRTKSFSDPQDFITSISSADTGCLILDLHMPQLDGLEVLEQLEAKKCRLPTIVITADIHAPIAARALAKAVDVLEKPIDPHVLIAAIQRAIAAGKRQSH